MYKKFRLLTIVGLLSYSTSFAQTENSPYSRYGIGDLINSQNAVNQGIGGVSAAYFDYSNLNLLNPAANSKIQSTAFNFGIGLSNRTIRSSNPPQRYSNYNPNISYLQIGVPLAKKNGWNLFFGLKPNAQISYKLSQNERITYPSAESDSVNNLYEGKGGLYAANIGTSINLFKNFSLGVNASYNFGSKDYSTRRTFINDTVNYYRSNHQSQANYNGLVLNSGLLYTIHINKNSILNLGAYGNLKSDLKATAEQIRETYTFNPNTGANIRIDSVYHSEETNGTVTLPMSYGVGFMYQRVGKWALGVDYTETKWSEYRFFGQTDFVQDSWELKAGFQIAPKGGERYWQNVQLNGGFNIGKDYIHLNEELNKWNVSVGLSLPMRKSMYSNQFSVIHTIFEYGKRGNADNILHENFFRFTVGLSLNDIWFIKRKYD